MFGFSSHDRRSTGARGARRRHRRWVVAAGVAAGLSLGCAAPASAAWIRVNANEGAIDYLAAEGEYNDITVAHDGAGNVTFTESDPVATLIDDDGAGAAS